MEIPNINADQGEVLRQEAEYEVRLAILGSEQIPSLGVSFVALLYAVIPKRKQIVMLRVHRADSYSIARRWGRIESRAVSQGQIEAAIREAKPFSDAASKSPA
jgi:hypothetical protein